MNSHVDSVQDVNPASTSEPIPQESGVEGRVEALWEQMNKGCNKNNTPESKKRTSSNMKGSQKPNDNWMAYLGLKPKISGSPEKNSPQKGHGDTQNGSSSQSGNVGGSCEQTNGGIPRKETGSSPNKSSAAVDQTSPNKSDSWKNYLGMGTKQAQSSENDASRERRNGLHTSTSDEAKKLAAAALSAVKDAAAAAAMRGKVEITEFRDFAGRDVEVKKLVDAESKEAAEKGKSSAPSAVDAVLEQIKKKQKLSVLDKTKKDWGEFKEENKGLEDELQTYKKSSNQYLDRVSFLQRTDYREFERERDARLAMQSRRRTDMR
ncbi:Craniofacial development protein 1, partial [Linum perenne]